MILRLLQLPAYLVLRVVVMVAGMFPYRMAPGLATVLGRILYLVDRKHVRIAVKNLYRTRGICAPDEIPAFIRRVYRHVALSFIEMLMIPRLMKHGQISKYVNLVDEPFRRCVREGRGGIIVIAHLGNWEVIGVAAALAGHPNHALMRPIDNPWIDAYLRRFRTQTGQAVIPRDRALAQMIRVIQRNKLLIVQVDQDARDAGVYVNFFGRPASTHRAPATLALKYNCPLVIANVYREGLINHMIIDEPLYPDAFRDAPDPVKALTQAYTDRLETFIRQHPEQWFWMHDRWKTAERVGRTATESLV